MGDNWWSPTARNPSLHEPHLAETISVGQRPRSTCISTGRQALPVVLSPYHTLKSIWPIRDATSRTPVPQELSALSSDIAQLWMFLHCIMVWIFFPSFSWHAASWWGVFPSIRSLERHHSPESPVAWLPRFVGIKRGRGYPSENRLKYWLEYATHKEGKAFPILVFSVTLRECMLVGYRSWCGIKQFW